jgi:hypothetical protein
MTNFGEISGNVTGDKTFEGHCTFYQGFSGAGVQVVKDSTIWYVDANKTGPAASGSGKTWKEAFLTITEALAAAGNYDVIFIGKGDYDEGAVLDITQTGLRMLGANTNLNQNNTLIWSDSATHHLLTISANMVEIAGIGFTQTKDTKDAIRISTAAAKYKAHIHNCRFDGYGQGEYGIHTGTTHDSPDVTVENCLFRAWQTVALHCNATRGLYRNNILHVPASKAGIEHVPNAADRPDQVYDNNKILGANSSDVGIKITNAPSAGTYLITKNLIANCATSITSKATNDAVCILNYVGDASGGALIDPSP